MVHSRSITEHQPWRVHIAEPRDLGRWLHFVESVQHDFHGLDLAHDKAHIQVVKKNIRRGTAIFVEHPSSADLVGALMFSPRSCHISWLAVSESFRRQGIGTSMVRFVFGAFAHDKHIEVKTFLETDSPGPAAHAFYKSLGFIPGDIVEDHDGLNGGKPFHLFHSYQR